LRICIQIVGVGNEEMPVDRDQSQINMRHGF
jgi:hypothetical protein